MSEQNGAGRGVLSAIAQTMETNTSRKVFGEPVTSGDVTVIPAARITGRGGGGGGGGGPDPEHHTGEGSGGGLFQSAKPMGAFVVRGSEVSWRPAIDINKIILGGQVVAIVALLVVFRELVKRRTA
jgi:uncharacterized spore protein YtfJ